MKSALRALFLSAAVAALLLLTLGPATSKAPAYAENVQATVISLPTNDIIYDPFSQKIYTSVPGSADSRANTITVIDPSTGTLGPSVFVGNDPGKLAISDNGQYLYVAVDGGASVRRFDIASLTPGLQFSLGGDLLHGAYYVEDMEVLPSNPNAVAISRKNLGFSPRHEGVAIYDNGVKLPDETPHHIGSNVIEFSDRASTLYGYNIEGESGFRRMSVNAFGVSVVDVTPGLIPGPATDIEFDAGLIYADSGHVIDPDALTHVATYLVFDAATGTTISASGPVEPDSTLGRTFILWRNTFLSRYALIVFDQLDSKAIGSIPLSSPSGTPTSLIRWGQHGLAFRTSSSQVFLIRPIESDGDGLPDVMDRCSSIPTGGFDADGDGCPDSLRRFATYVSAVRGLPDSERNPILNKTDVATNRLCNRGNVEGGLQKLHEILNYINTQGDKQIPSRIADTLAAYVNNLIVQTEQGRNVCA